MKLNNLSKQIDGQFIIEGIRFSLTPGQIVGLIGRNGSGKTTLFRIIANHYQADQGTVSIADKDLAQHLEMYQDLFYLDAQEHPLNNLTLQQIGKYYQLVTKYRSYSKGMQGLLHMIIAFATGANYVLLDEPFDGLDVLIKKQIIRLVLEEVIQHQRTVLVSSHNLSELENIIERALILKDKHLIKDYDSEQMRETAVKIQMVFNSQEVPALILEHCTIINQTTTDPLLETFSGACGDCRGTSSYDNCREYHSLAGGLPECFRFC